MLEFSTTDFLIVFSPCADCNTTGTEHTALRCSQATRLACGEHCVSEIVNSGIEGQPSGATLLSEGKLSRGTQLRYAGVSGILTRPDGGATVAGFWIIHY